LSSIESAFVCIRFVDHNLSRKGRKEAQMGSKLIGKWALVTGSSRGIGRQIVIGLADRGCNVIVHGREIANTAEFLQQLASIGVQTRSVAEIWGPKMASGRSSRRWVLIRAMSISCTTTGRFLASTHRYSISAWMGGSRFFESASSP
jgi:hypothetical protein